MRLDPPALQGMVRRLPPWLNAAAPHSDVVIRSRVTLHRNLAGQAFPGRLSLRERQRVLGEAGAVVRDLPPMREHAHVRLDRATESTRSLLRERHLASGNLAKGLPAGAVSFSADEHCVIQLNDEDHLRIQTLRPGLCLAAAWRDVNAWDDALGEHLHFAWSPRYGFLTANPALAGTGLHADTLLHLPGLLLTGHLGRVLRGIQALGYDVREATGAAQEGGTALYRLSNRLALGEDEESLVTGVLGVALQVAEHERNARSQLLERAPERLTDVVGRHYGRLRFGYTLDSAEALTALLTLRLGTALGMFRSLRADQLHELWLMTQPGHLQKRAGRTLEGPELDYLRAEYIRRRLEAAESGTSL